MCGSIYFLADDWVLYSTTRRLVHHPPLLCRYCRLHPSRLIFSPTSPAPKHLHPHSFRQIRLIPHPEHPGYPVPRRRAIPPLPHLAGRQISRRDPLCTHLSGETTEGSGGVSDYRRSRLSHPTRRGGWPLGIDMLVGVLLPVVREERSSQPLDT